MRFPTQFFIGAWFGLAGTMACSSYFAQTKKTVNHLRPACEAALLALPEVTERAERLEVTPEEYSRAVCALPGVALALAAGKEPKVP